MSTYIVKAKQLTDEEETREYHIKRLEQLALSHIGDIPQLDEPTYEQKIWFIRRMKGPARSWRRMI